MFAGAAGVGILSGCSADGAPDPAGELGTATEAVTASVIDVPTMIPDLRNTAGPASGAAVVRVLGRDSPGDAGGGLFRWLAASTVADDGGTVIAPSAGPPGRWLRVFAGPINVKWFGAKGDFQPASVIDPTGPGTDDTSAIQSALTAALARAVGVEGTAASPGMVTHPAVVIPSGIYKLTAPLTLSPWMSLIGDGNPALWQTAATDIVQVRHVRNVICGIQFVRGTRQIYIANENIDESVVEIEDCDFIYSSDYAIYTFGTRADIPGPHHLSTALTVRNCRFTRPRKVLFNYCDSALVEDCWIFLERGNFDANSAAFANMSGNLFLVNMFGVPVMGADATRLPRVRWIDQRGTGCVGASSPSGVYAERCRFGAEDAGIPIVYYFAPPVTQYPFLGTVLSFTGCELAAGLAVTADAGVIVLQGHVPQLVRLVGNFFPANAPYVANPDGLDVAAYMAVYRGTETRFRFELEPNMTVGMPTLEERGLTALRPATRWLDTTELVSSPPVNGTWVAGQRVWNSAPQVGAPSGWVCIQGATAGSPAQWAALGIAQAGVDRSAVLVLAAGANHNVVLASTAPPGSVPSDYQNIEGPTGDFTITGIAGGVDGREIVLLNSTLYTMTLAHWHPGSAAQNRLGCRNGGSIVLPGQWGSATLRYAGRYGIWQVKCSH